MKNIVSLIFIIWLGLELGFIVRDFGVWGVWVILGFWVVFGLYLM